MPLPWTYDPPAGGTAVGAAAPPLSGSARVSIAERARQFRAQFGEGGWRELNFPVKPAAAATVGQRVILVRDGDANKLGVFGSVLGTAGDFTLELAADPTSADGFEFDLVSDQGDTLWAILKTSLGAVIFGTNTVWAAKTPFTSRLFDANPIMEAQISQGAKPVLAMDTPVFATAGEALYALRPSDTQGLYGPVDITTYVRNIFGNDGRRRVMEIEYAHAPSRLLWVLLGNEEDGGTLYSCCLHVGSGVYGWTEHDLGAPVHAIQSATEGGVNVVYALVERGDDLALEKMSTAFREDDRAQILGSDDAYRVTFPAERDLMANPLGGLTWLAGEDVDVVMDGESFETAVSDMGELELTDLMPMSATTLSVGRKQVARFATLPIVVRTQRGSSLAVPLAPQALALRVLDLAAQLWVGREAEPGEMETLYPVQLRTTESTGEATRRRTGVLDEQVQGGWDPDASLVVEKRGGLAASIVGIATDVSVGEN